MTLSFQSISKFYPQVIVLHIVDNHTSYISENNLGIILNVPLLLSFPSEIRTC